MFAAAEYAPRARPIRPAASRTDFAPEARQLRSALAGDPTARQELFLYLQPSVSARVGRVLRRWRGRPAGGDLHLEQEDLTQEVMLALMVDGHRLLRSWDPARGLTLRGFVGLIAERMVSSRLRTARSNPWVATPAPSEKLERSDDGSAERRMTCRLWLASVQARMLAALTPSGRAAFGHLILAQRSVAEVCARTGMTPAAVYAWRSRLFKLARRLG